MNLFKYKYYILKYINILSIKKIKSTNRCLMYHSIFNDNRYYVDHYSVRFLEFKKQMKFLKKNAENLVHFDEFVESECSISITFDDGFKDNLTLVAPLMEDLELPWTIFVVSDFLSDEYPDYMSKEDLLELSKYRFVKIGAHGKTHQPLASMKFEDAERELRESKKEIENILGQQVLTMSFPHGSFSQDLLRCCKDLGYKNVGISVPYRNDSKAFAINRFSIFEYDSVLDLRFKISGHWDWFGKRYL